MVAKLHYDECVEIFTRRLRVDGDCLVWTGNIDRGANKHKYGKLWFYGRCRRAHQVAWEVFHGPVPKGFDVLHACDNPPCVNPKHLFLGTHFDNMRDGRSKGRWKKQNNFYSSKTKCPQGHAYSGDNLKITANGWRICRTCQHDHHLRFNEIRRRKNADLHLRAR